MQPVHRRVRVSTRARGRKVHRPGRPAGPALVVVGRLRDMLAEPVPDVPTRTRSPVDNPARPYGS